jgi:hypothetical protein
MELFVVPLAGTLRIRKDKQKRDETSVEFFVIGGPKSGIIPKNTIVWFG